MIWLQALLLVVVANGAPVAAWRLLDRRWALPVDAGMRLADGRPLFGPTKTVRGAASAVAAATGAALLLELPWQAGALAGAGAMTGDLLSSFVKRRLGMAPSRMALGLDQIPESLIPLLLVKHRLALDAADIAAAVLGFVVVELALSRVLFWLELRKRPH
ncbi:MAG: CDP-archaeol synthase [Gammaproteobacteria bacterium]|nr:CDP-archaeol synthase [Gammaproteobacteria bacterium]NIR98479.1 CDP-archaeol synthase [Gammaproteobacteria bacterium]NIT64223.1 CDP-archaeol synthase [Gammaproteobacteria bacterium]NIV21167.1 CDP-archaeol synthase [Gammaproteobacteria bacterium]NIX10735.1 CDP-archaeol synthase [Gammaproteobacteria bacterium]